MTQRPGIVPEAGHSSPSHHVICNLGPWGRDGAPVAGSVIPLANTWPLESGHEVVAGYVEDGLDRARHGDQLLAVRSEAVEPALKQPEVDVLRVEARYSHCVGTLAFLRPPG
jgi:hypothetical protein